MGNICQNSQKDYVPQLIPDGNQDAHKNYKDAKYKKDKPKTSYASAISKRPKLLPLVQQTLKRVKNQKKLEDPYQPGIQLPPYTLNVISQGNSIAARSQIGPVGSSSIKHIPDQPGQYLQIPGQRDPKKKHNSSIKAVPGKVYYQGQWMTGKPHGSGKLYLPDGSYFEGGFRDGQIDCQDGVSIYPDGSYYRGNFKRNECSGTGKFVYSVNNFTYEGNWQNNRPHGYGTQQYHDGSRYDGQFRDGFKHGKGNFYWSNGMKYTGEFENGYMHGHGLLAKGNGSYQGTFFRNQKTGGRMKTQYGEYIGRFVNGQMQDNEGQFKWNDGKVYRGQFKANNMHGNGRIIYPNGQVAVGEWYEGQNKIIQNIKQK